MTEQVTQAALAQFIYETTHLSPMEEDGSHWCKISAECLANGRSALNTRTQPARQALEGKA